MLRRFISASLLLLLVAVQALAADCELRCATMTAAFEHHGCGHLVESESSSAPAAHCHGMTMESGKESSSLSASDKCHASICRFQSEAVAKQSGTDEFSSLASAIILPVQLNRNLAAGGSTRPTIGRSHFGQETQAPLDLRPGSSLRI
jgi:hypothetical protein